MKSLEEILGKAVENKASDIFIITGASLSYKVAGKIQDIFEDGERMMPAMTEELIDQIYKTANRSKDHYLERGDDDFSLVNKVQRVTTGAFGRSRSQGCAASKARRILV